MLKKLAVIGLGAAFIFTPVISMAQTTPAPDATPAASAPAKPMAHKAKAKHVVKKHMTKAHKAMKPMPAPTPTATPQS